MSVLGISLGPRQAPLRGCARTGEWPCTTCRWSAARSNSHALRALLLGTPEPAAAVYAEWVSAMPRQGVAS